MGPDRQSWRGPATDLREVLDHVAPDKEVTVQQGFKLEKNQIGLTMKQKVRFILGKRRVSKNSKQDTGNHGVSCRRDRWWVREICVYEIKRLHTPTE
jgi:hypothetical protein